jgi:hypothetical protein
METKEHLQGLTQLRLFSTARYSAPSFAASRVKSLGLMLPTTSRYLWLVRFPAPASKALDTLLHFSNLLLHHVGAQVSDCATTALQRQQSFRNSEFPKRHHAVVTAA